MVCTGFCPHVVYQPDNFIGLVNLAIAFLPIERVQSTLLLNIFPLPPPPVLFLGIIFYPYNNVVRFSLFLPSFSKDCHFALVKMEKGALAKYLPEHAWIHVPYYVNELEIDILWVGWACASPQPLPRFIWDF